MLSRLSRFIRSFRPTAPGGRVRLRTLILIRWVAIAGQLFAILFVHFSLGFPLPLVPVLIVVAASAALNLMILRYGRGAMRLGGRQIALSLGFDLLQLGALIFLTGGLHNPFSILILAPVIVSATILTWRSTTQLSLIAIAMVAILAVEHWPLPWPPGETFTLAPLYIAGFALALLLSILFIGAYVASIALESRRMSDALAATQRALDRERRLSSLGALAAAAAHELGSPLGTIAVVAKEIARDLPADSPLKADMDLLRAESERCRRILAELVAEPEAEGGAPFEVIPLETAVEAAAQPHRRPGIALSIVTDPAAQGPMPLVRRRAELQHGLGNLLQNAIEFARSRVDVRLRWDRTTIVVTIADDGQGFAETMLGRLGEPYLSGGDQGRGGEHMGLGIFIADTLIGMTGGSLRLGNRTADGEPGGAEAVVTWPRVALETAAEWQRSEAERMEQS
ncbi:MAG: ActS/PrrB/RegB family redox-sensitive histidine kinase [Rhodospirillaceae bacterium]|nr:ActS/PrrB/RegB family redox-sensitive histidine kinase [Rhodospirillaceae bacterium]